MQIAIDKYTSKDFVAFMTSSVKRYLLCSISTNVVAAHLLRNAFEDQKRKMLEDGKLANNGR